MAFLPIPDRVCERVDELTPAWLAEHGIRAVLMDLDNTVTRFKGDAPEPWAAQWIDELSGAGLMTAFLSNNSGERVERFCAPLGITHLHRAAKPRRRGYLELALRLGVSCDQALMVGDQIYTDVWGAKRCGMTAVLVRPISLREKRRYQLRRILEYPFIWLGALIGGRRNRKKEAGR